MKKHRKQSVNVLGKKQLVDVPVDSELYKADNRAEYQRARSKTKDVPWDASLFADLTADVVEIYEESQLLEFLREALQALSDEERQLIEYIFYEGLTEQETADILKVARQTVGKKKHRIINKLRNSLVDWSKIIVAF